MIQKFLITMGIILLVSGIMWPVLAKLGFGRLPGDFVLKRGDVTIFLPISSMIVASLLLTLIVRIFFR